jgi:hypothetical protein
LHVPNLLYLCTLHSCILASFLLPFAHSRP